MPFFTVQPRDAKFSEHKIHEVCIQGQSILYASTWTQIILVKQVWFHMLLFSFMHQTKSMCCIQCCCSRNKCLLQLVFYFRSTIYLNNVMSILMAQTIEFKYWLQENLQYVHCEKWFSEKWNSWIKIHEKENDLRC